MLERLDEINWSELSTAYGSANHVPGWIRDLTSSNSAVWSKALDKLWWTILHQGSLYSATTATIPFLIELLDEPLVRCRGYILYFLARVAGTNSHVDMLWRRYGQELLDVDAYEHSLRRFWEEEVQTRDHVESGQLYYILEELEQSAQDEEHRQILTETLLDEHQAKAAVWSGLKTYTRLLDDPDPYLRLNSPYVLGELGEGASRTLSREAVGNTWHFISQAMLQRLEIEQNPLIQASLIQGVNVLYEQRPENLDAILTLLQRSLSPSVHLSALWSLSEGGVMVPQEEVGFLIEFWEHSDINALFDTNEANGFPKVQNKTSKSLDWMVAFPWCEEKSPRSRTEDCLDRIEAQTED